MDFLYVSDIKAMKIASFFCLLPWNCVLQLLYLRNSKLILRTWSWGNFRQTNFRFNFLNFFFCFFSRLFSAPSCDFIKSMWFYSFPIGFLQTISIHESYAIYFIFFVLLSFQYQVSTLFCTYTWRLFSYQTIIKHVTYNAIYSLQSPHRYACEQNYSASLQCFYFYFIVFFVHSMPVSLLFSPLFC